MMKKFFGLFLAMVICVMSLGTVFASSGAANGWTVGQASVPMPDGASGVVNKVFGALQSAGIIVGTFILVFFGFKYLTAGAGDKAKTKEMLVPFIIGAAVIMLAPAIASWIWSFKG